MSDPSETNRQRLVWITGGSSGIGLAAAYELSRAGFPVALTGRREKPLIEACEAIARDGGKADYAVADVCDARAVRAAHAAIAGRNGPVSVLINSAGFNVAERDWNEVSDDQFDATIAANLNGTFYATQAVLPAMREAKDGVIVNVASWAGRYVAHGSGPAYTAAKHAVFAMTSSLNMAEVANGIRACAFCPGEVDTPIMLARKQPPSPEALRRMLGAPEVAKLIRTIVELPPSMMVSEILITPTGVPRD